MGSCVTTAADVQAGYSIPIQTRGVGAVRVSDRNNKSKRGPQHQTTTRRTYAAGSQGGAGGSRQRGREEADVHNDRDAFEDFSSDEEDSTTYETDTSDYVFDSVSSCSDNVRLRCMLFNASTPHVLLPSYQAPGESSGGPIYHSTSANTTLVGAAGEGPSLLPLYRPRNQHQSFTNAVVNRSSSNNNTNDAMSEESRRTAGRMSPATNSPSQGDGFTPPSQYDSFIASLHQYIIPLLLSGDARVANLVGSRFGAGYCHTLQALRFVSCRRHHQLFYNAGGGALAPVSYGRKRQGNSPHSSQPQQQQGGSSSHVRRLQALQNGSSSSLPSGGGRRRNGDATVHFSFTRDVMCYGGIDKQGLLFHKWKDVESQRRRQHFKSRAKRAKKAENDRSARGGGGGVTPRRAAAAKKKKDADTASSTKKGSNHTNKHSELSKAAQTMQSSRNSKKPISDFSSSSDTDASPRGGMVTTKPATPSKAGNSRGGATSTSSSSAAKKKIAAALSAIPKPSHPRSRFLRYIDVLDSPFIEYGTSKGEVRRYVLGNDYVPPSVRGINGMGFIGSQSSAQDIAANAMVGSCGDDGHLGVSGSGLPMGVSPYGAESLLSDFRVLTDEDHFIYDLPDFAPKVTTGGAAAMGGGSQIQKLDSIGSSLRGSSPSGSANIPSRQQTLQVSRAGASPSASPLGADHPKSPRGGDSTSQLSDEARDIVNRAKSTTRRRNSPNPSLNSGYYENVNLTAKNVLSSDGGSSSYHGGAPARTPAQRAAAKRHTREQLYIVFGETCKYEVDDLRQPGGMTSQEDQLGGLAGVSSPSTALLPNRTMGAAASSPTVTGLPNGRRRDSDVELCSSVEDEAGSRSNTDDGAVAEETPCSWAVSRKFKVFKTFVQHGITSDPDQFTKALEEDSVLMHRRDVVRIATWIDDILQIALLNHLSQIATKSCPNLSDYYGTHHSDVEEDEEKRPTTQAFNSSATTAQSATAGNNSSPPNTTPTGRTNSVGWVGENSNEMSTDDTPTPGGAPSLFKLANQKSPGSTTPTSAIIQGIPCNPVIRAVTFAAGLQGRRRIRKRVRVLRLKCTAMSSSQSWQTAELKGGGLELDASEAPLQPPPLQLHGGETGPSATAAFPNTNSAPTTGNLAVAAAGGKSSNHEGSNASSKGGASKSANMMDSYGETHSSNFRGGNKTGSGLANHTHSSLGNIGEAAVSTEISAIATSGRPHALDVDVSVVPPRLSLSTNTKKSNSTTEDDTQQPPTATTAAAILEAKIAAHTAASHFANIQPLETVRSSVEVMSIRAPKKTIRRLFDVRLRCAPDLSAHIDIKALFRAVNNFATSVNYATSLAAAATQQQHGSFHNVPCRFPSGFLDKPQLLNNNSNNTVDETGGPAEGELLGFVLPLQINASTSDNPPQQPSFTNNGLLAAGNNKNRPSGSGGSGVSPGSGVLGTPVAMGISSNASQRSGDSRHSNPASSTLVLPPGLLHNGGVVVSSPITSMFPPSIFELQQLCLVANNPRRDVGCTSHISSDTNIPLVAILTSLRGSVSNSTLLGDGSIIASALETIDYPLGEFVVGTGKKKGSDDDDDDDDYDVDNEDYLSEGLAGSPTISAHLLPSATSSLSQMAIQNQQEFNMDARHLTPAQRHHQYLLQMLLSKLQATASVSSSAPTGYNNKVGGGAPSSPNTGVQMRSITGTAGEGSISNVKASAGVGKQKQQQRSTSPFVAAGEGSGNTPLDTLLPGSTSQSPFACDSPVRDQQQQSADNNAATTPSVPMTNVTSATMPPPAPASPLAQQLPQQRASCRSIPGATDPSSLGDDSLVSPHTHNLQSSTAAGLIQASQNNIASPLAPVANGSTSSGFNQLMPRLPIIANNGGGSSAGSMNTPGGMRTSQLNTPNLGPENNNTTLFAWKERTMTADALKAYIKYQQFLAKQRKKEDSAFERRLLATPPSIRQLVFGQVPYSRGIVRPGLLSPNQYAMQQHQQQLLASLASTFSNLPAHVITSAYDRHSTFYDTLTQDDGSDGDGS